MESGTKASEANESEGKVINVGHLLSYLRRVKDERKR